MKSLDNNFKNQIWPSFADSMVVILSIFIFLFVITLAKNNENNREAIKNNETLKKQQKALEIYKKENEELKNLNKEFGLYLKKISPDIIKLDKNYVSYISGDFLFPKLEDKLSNSAVISIKNLSPKLIFAFKKAKKDKQELLNKNNKLLMVQVAGYTDNDPIKGNTKFKDNWDLSSSRASNVVREFQKNSFPSKSIYTSGFGEYQSLNSNLIDNEKAQNRRITIKLLVVDK